MTPSEIAKLEELHTKRIMEELPRDNIMCNTFGGCMHGVEWTGVEVVFRVGEKIHADLLQGLAKELAVAVPWQVLKMAAELGEQSGDCSVEGAATDHSN